MARCKNCGHLSSLHSKKSGQCHVTARGNNKYRPTYTCNCNNYQPEPPKPKKTWTKKEIIKILSTSNTLDEAKAQVMKNDRDN